MTFLQLNIALVSLVLILVSLMGACLFYSLHTLKIKLEKLKKMERN